MYETLLNIIIPYYILLGLILIAIGFIVYKFVKERIFSIIGLIVLVIGIIVLIYGILLLI